MLLSKFETLCVKNILNILHIFMDKDEKMLMYALIYLFFIRKIILY